MTFDPSITLGALLNAVALLIGFVGAFVRIGGRIDLLSQRLLAVENTLVDKRDHEKRLSIAEERLANHGSALATLQRELSSLRRGEGFIRGHRSDVDGEYSS